MEELVSGGLAGISQTIIGYPLDTVKVCLVDRKPIVIRNLYQGCLSPLFGAFFVNAQTFYMYNFLRSRDNNVITSGFVTGLGVSLIEGPTELVKIRMQLSHNPTYTQTIKNIGFKRLFHGLIPTLWRNGISLASYFYCYELITGKFENRHVGSLIGGAVAGFACWTLPYPIDCIKSQIQADLSYKLNIRSFIRYKKLRKGLWRGYLPCVTRSVIVNPFIFLTYEMSKNIFY